MGVRIYRTPTTPPRRSNSFGGFSVNTNIIIINVILFFVLSLFFDQKFIFENIAISLDNVLGLRLWTFLTSMFMHGGFIHLFVNMFSLMFIGGLVQKILGAKRYIHFYLAAGLLAGGLYILSELFSATNLPAVGASGALFGLVGLLVILTPNLPVYLMFIPIPIKMKYAGPGMLIVLWLISAAADIPIGNMAHFGGLIAGLIYGVYLKSRYKHKTQMLNKHFS